MGSSSPTDGDRTNGPRSRKGERTRARLVDAAKVVFEENGFLDARISDIAEEAGLSHGSFYHYFDSKEAVFLEVAEAQGERFSYDSILRQGGFDTTDSATLADVLRDSIRVFLEQYREEARIMGVIEQVSRYHEPVRDVRAVQQQRYHQQAEQAIRVFQENGQADPDLDPAIAAGALIGMMVRFAEMWFVQDMLECSFDDGVETLSSVTLNAMGVASREG